MALTPEMIQAMNQATGNQVPLNPNAPPSRAEQIRALGKTAAPEKPQAPGYLERVGSDISSAFHEGSQAESNAVAGKENPFSAGATIAKDVSSIPGSFIGEAISPAVSPVLKYLSDKLSDAKPIKALADLMEQHPELSNTLTDLVQTGNNVVGARAALEGGGAAKEAAPDTINAVKTAIKGTPEEQAAAAETAKATKAADTATKLKKVADDWAKPTTLPGNTFRNAKAVLAKSPDIPDFLSKQGVNPSAHVEDGKYVTDGTASDLRETAGKMSTDTLRPSLQIADYNTPKTPISEIVQAAEKSLRQDKGITPGDFEHALSGIQKEAEALQKKFPEGMSLTDMHDYKITYAKNGGYSPVKSASDNLKSTSNRALGDALGTMVETKAPKEVPVGDFNKYLSQYYKAADYLTELNGKKAPVTLGQQIARGVAKYGGATLGGHFGGGVVSEFAGYQIGKALEHAAENLTNPMRASFLSNLEKTNPQAFTAVQDYLAQKAGGNVGTPKLPAPSSMITPEPSQEAQMAGRAEQISTPTKILVKTVQDQMPNLQKARAYDIAERASGLPAKKQLEFIKQELAKIKPESLPK